MRILPLSLITLLSLSAFAESFDVSWSTIDSGGGFSSGGDFSLGGTIGQADAGYHTGGTITPPFASAEFDLTGGFWGIFNVDTGPQITSDLAGSADVGDFFSYKITTLGTIPMTYEALSLPPGLTLTGDTISGTILNAGMSTIHLFVHNHAGDDSEYLILNLSGGGSHGATPRILSKPIATPNPVIVGTQVTFDVLATDEDGDIISYYWQFGDETTSRDPLPTHTYSSPGTYVVHLVVSDGKRQTFTQFNLIVSPLTINSTLITKLTLQFDFRKPSRSQLIMQGQAVTPQPLLVGTRAILDVGPGLHRDYMLDAKGAGGDMRNLISFKRGSTGAVTSFSKLLIHMKNPASDTDPATLFSQLQGLGFVSGKTEGKGVVIHMPVSLKVVPPGQDPNNVSAQIDDLPVTYKTAPFRSGKGTMKR